MHFEISELSWNNGKQDEMGGVLMSKHKIVYPFICIFMCFKVKIIAECKVLLEFCSNPKFEKKGKMRDKV